MEHYLTGTDSLILMGGKNIFSFHFISFCLLFPSHIPSQWCLPCSPRVSPLSWDPSSIILNSSSKPSTPPHPPPCISLPSLLFWFYELDVLCLLCAAIHHFKSKVRHIQKTPPISLVCVVNGLSRRS